MNDTEKCGNLILNIISMFHRFNSTEMADYERPSAEDDFHQFIISFFTLHFTTNVIIIMAINRVYEA